jgi:hypothetical protein
VCVFTPFVASATHELSLAFILGLFLKLDSSLALRRLKQIVMLKHSVPPQNSPPPPPSSPRIERQLVNAVRRWGGGGTREVWLYSIFCIIRMYTVAVWHPHLFLRPT